jgi:hypothetical protein
MKPSQGMKLAAAMFFVAGIGMMGAAFVKELTPFYGVGAAFMGVGVMFLGIAASKSKDEKGK